MLRLDLDEISRALLEVEVQWPRIEAALDELRLGRRPPFTPVLRCNMLSAYEYLDQVLVEGVEPFSDLGMEHMLALNAHVHYGRDIGMLNQFGSAIGAR